jgi:phosphate transport system permease protein
VIRRPQVVGAELLMQTGGPTVPVLLTRKFIDTFSTKVMATMTVCASLVIVVMTAGLLYKSLPLLATKPLFGLLFSGSWQPLQGEFGFFPFIAGSLIVTVVAVALALPLSLLTALFLSEYAHARVRESVKPLIDILAGIPSIVYGMWGIVAIVPLVKNPLAPLFRSSTAGYCVATAGIVLAVMIVPIIIHVCCEVLGAVPQTVKEASLSLGATRWQTTKLVCMRKALPGLIAATVLSVSRAFGETMAVLMVAGNVPAIPKSLFDPAYPLPALIANNYGEMVSVPLYDSAMLFSALLLLAVILAFTILSRAILARFERDAAL